MSKVRNLERELYDIYQDLSPQRIRKIVKLSYIRKIQDILGEDMETENDDEKMMEILRELNLNNYYLGYTDALEEFLVKNKPDLEPIIFPSQLKAQLMLEKDDDQVVNLNFILKGAVPTYKIRELILKVAAENISLEGFIEGLEKLMLEAEN